MAAAEALFARVLGHRAAAGFRLTLDVTSTGTDWFELRDMPQRPQPPAVGAPPAVGITGNSGVALASGLHWYLKYACNASIAYGAPLLNASALPTRWPPVGPTLRRRVESPFADRFYFNPVAHSYAAAFWDWPRWEAEIDFMAMLGVSLPLALTGQEFVWDRVWREHFNLSEAELAEHWPGPAFLVLSHPHLLGLTHPHLLGT